MEKITSSKTFTGSAVRNLKIDASCAKIRFEASSDEDVHVKTEIMEGCFYTCEMREDTLFISHEWHRKHITIRLNGHEESLIVLYLPDNISFSCIECELGAGKIKMSDVPFSCENMKMDIGAGKWKAERLHVTGKLTMDIGAGKVKLQNAKAGSLSLDCGAGKCVYEGRIDGDCTVDCGAGTCIFQLENKESDFDYDISCAFGQIRVNERKITLLGAEKVRNNECAIGKATLECGVGTIIFETT